MWSVVDDQYCESDDLYTLIEKEFPNCSHQNRTPQYGGVGGAYRAEDAEGGGMANDPSSHLRTRSNAA